MGAGRGHIRRVQAVDVVKPGPGEPTISAKGDKEWRADGKLHRVDGPTVERVNGNKEWHVDGVELTEAEFDKLISERREEAQAAAETARRVAMEEVMMNPEYRDPFGANSE